MDGEVSRSVVATAAQTTNGK